jgi:hypothetical protein
MSTLALEARRSLVRPVSGFSNALLVALACCASAASAQTGTVNDFTGTLVPAGDNGPEPVAWRSVPTPAQVRELFPKKATKSGYMVWKCRVQGDGRLNACVLRTQWPPKDGRYKVAAEKLLPLFRADEQTVRLARREGKAILFILPVYRPGSQSFSADDCPPPFCVPVAPPPKP